MTTLLRSSDLMPLREAFDRLFEQAFTTFPTWMTARAGLEVPVDVYEAGEEFVIRAVLPGIKPEDVQVTCLDGTITISAELKPWAQEGLKPIFQEIGAGTFRREVHLPVAVDLEKAEAVYEHGVLTLRLPKAEQARRKAIPVKVGAPARA